MSEWVNEWMSDTPLNPLSKGDLKLSLRDTGLKSALSTPFDFAIFPYPFDFAQG